MARQPETILSKSASGAKKSIVYGYPMSSAKMKQELEMYTRDWLLEERGEEDGRIMRNLDMILDLDLLEEFVAYNRDGNFDRVSAFFGCIAGLEETHNQYKILNTEKKKSMMDFLHSNKNLFPKRHESVGKIYI